MDCDHLIALKCYDIAHGVRKAGRFECFAIGGDGCAFAMLAFGENGVFIARDEDLTDGHPPAVTGRGRRRVAFAQSRLLALQFARELRPLFGALLKERLQVGALDGLRSGGETRFIVFADLDQVFNDRRDVAVHTSKSCAHRRARVSNVRIHPSRMRGPILRFRTMPPGDKRSYTDKQKRQAAHIAESYKARGVDADEAEGRAWATVNKEDGGGKKSGSGRKAATGKKTR